MSDLEKLNLIYIVSIGHSGSTLLESILGAHSQIVTGGEIQIWPHEIRQDTLPCACGKSISQCEFWCELQNRINPLNQKPPRIDFFREQHNAGHTIRVKELSRLMKNSKDNVASEIFQYGLNNYHVYKEFMNLMEEMTHQKPRWIVDSSKDPYRLIWLINSGLFNIRALHVIKNPRAFVYSMLKRLPERQKRQISAQLYESARQTFKWSFENYLSTWTGEKYLGSDEYMLVKYESMAFAPESFFENLFGLLNLDFNREILYNFRDEAMHTIAGNPMRYRSGGIKYDEKWKRNLESYNGFLADIISFPIKSRYGY